MFKNKKKGCYKGYIDEKSGVILAMGNDNGPVTDASKFEATEPLGKARRWSREDKDYVCVPRPALIGFCNKSIGGMIKWIKQFLPTDHLPAIRNDSGYFSCIACRYLYTIDDYYTSYLRKNVSSLNIYNQLQPPT